MKTPAALQPLIDDGVIDEVLRSLKSGKEATVYLVRSGAHTRCAKVYRNMAQRSFQRRARYQEGRKPRGSREARLASYARYLISTDRWQEMAELGWGATAGRCVPPRRRQLCRRSRYR